MTRATFSCEAFSNSPFSFWATRPAGVGSAVGCSDCEDAVVDWHRAKSDEIHLRNGGEGKVDDSGAFSTRRYVLSLAINYLLSDGEAIDRPECVRLESRRGWWADAWRTGGDGFRLGSRLWSLQWEAATQETLVKARQYAEQALAPLVTLKIAARVSVAAKYVGRGIIHLQATIAGPYGKVGLAIEGVENPPYGFLWREVSDG